MRIIKTNNVISAANDPASVNKLGEIQQQMRDMCEPQYDEFHKVTNERGFVKITIPKKRG
jgi:hypothetical protein